MPYINCRCGNKIDYSNIPCENKFLVISDVDCDHYQGLIDAEKLYIEMIDVYKCPNCSRLWIYNKDNKPIVYKPE